MPEATAEGLRTGEPETLALLCTRRGGAALAYAEHVAPGKAGLIAAAAFARFRAAVAAGVGGSDPDALLLRMTRRAAAAHSLPASTSQNAGESPDCMTRELLVGWMEETLAPARHDAFEQHVADCADCAARIARFEAAERAYAHPPRAPVPWSIARLIVSALVTAAPVTACGGDVAAVRAAAERTIRGQPPDAPGPAVAATSDTAPPAPAPAPAPANVEPSAPPAPPPAASPPAPAPSRDLGRMVAPIGRSLPKRAALAVLFTLSVTLAVLAFLNLSESSGKSPAQGSSPERAQQSSP
jgi:hypothetical protein